LSSSGPGHACQAYGLTTREHAPEPRTGQPAFSARPSRLRGGTRIALPRER
jgi:hypothetical protein